MRRTVIIKKMFFIIVFVPLALAACVSEPVEQNTPTIIDNQEENQNNPEAATATPAH